MAEPRKNMLTEWHANEHTHLDASSMAVKYSQQNCSSVNRIWMAMNKTPNKIKQSGRKEVFHQQALQSPDVIDWDGFQDVFL